MRTAAAFIVLAFTLACAPAHAQKWPEKPVRMVLAYPAGGNSDVAARVIAPKLQEILGQPFVVENKPGAGGMIAGELVAKSVPDGYTLFVTANAPILFSPTVFGRSPYLWHRDFVAVGPVSFTPLVLVVNPTLPAKTVAELVALAKARPGELNYSSGPIGTPQHLTGELFNAVARVNIVVIPYRGSGPAVTALLGGQVQLMFPTAGAVNEHVKAGRLRALAVTSAQPSPLLPGLPAVAEAVPGYESISIQAVYVPAKTPEAIVRRLNQEFVRVLNLPDVRERLMKAGVEPVGSSSEQLAAAIKTEMSKWGALIKSNGIHE